MEIEKICHREIGTADQETAATIEVTSGRGPMDSCIRCPKCRWSPGAEDRWCCNCGHIWNTFDTGGVCPACLHQWQITMCPRCGEWSAHSEWYRSEERRVGKEGRTR